MKKIHPLVEQDPLLKPYSHTLTKRSEKIVLRILEFTDGKDPLKDHANHHLYYGLHKTDNGWVFREKAPNATQLYLYGDFSYWQISEKYALTALGNGDWEIYLPAAFLKHGELFRLWVVWHGGASDRLPAYINRVVQDDVTKVFSAQVWDPKPYQWQHQSPPKPKTPIIYEAHIGMSSEKAEVSNYWDFKENVLPHIHELGYNVLQLMAIQEHPYYGSFGYQVANFFAPSSRFGTPEELKELIDAAHSLGIYVILDVVHSHSVSNEKEGLSHFDGSDNLYFHSGIKGKHPVWESRCFNYGKSETILFLLSNIKYWMEAFRFDGFRFDGVTSMSYWNHGIGVDFVDYSQYFDDNVDEDALVYLAMANTLIKEINEEALTIAEDVSGMPGMAVPVKKGGIGFDYRMSMGIADYWSQLVKKTPDELWHVGDIYFRLTDKRTEEKTISYVESHDQAMVGDKTLITQLIDAEMYTHMSKFTHSLVVDRGIALHKITRLLTFALCNNGYLNFMGNEFGHPEWIDFPRQGNNWSLQYARRQWHLLNDQNLKYHYLNDFDKAMLTLAHQTHFLEATPSPVVRDIEKQVLAFQRKNLIFVANLNPTDAYINLEIPCRNGDYKVILNSDNPIFGGFGNIDEQCIYPAHSTANGSFLKLYLPPRLALILTPKI